jgi:hypothetical protein
MSIQIIQQGAAGGGGGSLQTNLYIPGLGTLDLRDFTLAVGAPDFASTVLKHFVNLIEIIDIPVGMVTIPVDFARYCTNTTTVHIPASVTTVSTGAFAEMPALESIVFPPACTTIGNGACFNDVSLTTVVLPQSVPAVSLGTQLFDGCVGLQEITYPATQRIIPDMFCRNTRNYKNVTLPLPTTTIGVEAFLGCGAETVNFEQLTALASVGQSAFNGTFALKEAVFGSTILATIGQAAFYGSGIEVLDLSACLPMTVLPIQLCSRAANLTTFIPPPNLITFTAGTNAQGAFLECTALNNIQFPPTLANIGAYTFTSCTHFTEIDLSNCPLITTGLGEGAFYNCQQVTKLVLPPNCTRLLVLTFRNLYRLKFVRLPFPLVTLTAATSGNGAFSYCTDLECVVFENPAIAIGAYTFSNSRPGAQIKFYCPTDITAKLTAANVSVGVTWTYGGTLEDFAADYPDGYPLT